MTPIQTLSRLRAHILAPIAAWEIACNHLHESMGWSAVLSYALKEEPSLHPELFAILSNAIPGEDASVVIAFNALKKWVAAQNEQQLAPVLAIWASQSRIEQCTVSDLIKSTPLSWRWDMAVSLMPTGQIRTEHQTLVHVFWMINLERSQSRGHHVDPSISSTVFFP